MPLQFPNLAQISTPLAQFKPQTMRSVLSEIAKDRRAEEQLTLQKIAEVRQQKEQESLAAARKERAITAAAQEQRLDAQRKATTRYNAWGRGLGVFKETGDNDAAWGVMESVDPSLKDMPSEQRVQFSRKEDDAVMSIPVENGGVMDVTMPYENVSAFQKALMADKPQPIDKLINKHGGYVSARKAGAEETKGGEGEYTPQQLVDDTRGYYSTVMRGLMDEDGFVKEGKEAEFNRLTDDMHDDMVRIKQGQTPKWQLPKTEQRTEPKPKATKESIVKEFKKQELEAGVYKVDGVEYEWDGKDLTEVAPLQAVK